MSTKQLSCVNWTLKSGAIPTNLLYTSTMILSLPLRRQLTMIVSRFTTDTSPGNRTLCCYNTLYTGILSILPPFYMQEIISGLIFWPCLHLAVDTDTGIVI